MDRNDEILSAINDNELLLKVFDDADELQGNADQYLSEELRSIEERYQLHECVGEGMVKKVYRAFDRLMERDVAFATLRSDEPQVREEFIREIRLTASLEHANIAPVYDMGFDSAGVPFFVTKLYDESDLRDLLNQRRDFQSLEERIVWTLSVFLKVCEAVAFAHSRGVLHFDIKPSNIQMSDYGEVMLCDWGIARTRGTLFEHSGKENSSEPEVVISQATLNGEVRGTPGFMAPEMMDKECRSDERSDVYGLGALLFTMIKGMSPVNGKNLDTVDFPAEIKAICHKALEEAQEDRYQNVEALINDVEKYQNGLVTMAEKAGLIRYLRKWMVRHRKVVAICVVNLLILISTLAGYIYSIKKSEQKQSALAVELQLERDVKLEERLRHAGIYYEQAKLSASSARS